MDRQRAVESVGKMEGASSFVVSATLDPVRPNLTELRPLTRQVKRLACVTPLPQMFFGDSRVETETWTDREKHVCRVGRNRIFATRN